MSEILPMNQFHNIGVIARVTRVLVAKSASFMTAYGMMSYSIIMPDYWFFLAMTAIVYLLFTGLLGWDPIEALDRSLKRQGSKCEASQSSVENQLGYAIFVYDKT